MFFFLLWVYLQACNHHFFSKYCVIFTKTEFGNLATYPDFVHMLIRTSISFKKYWHMKLSSFSQVVTSCDSVCIVWCFFLFFFSLFTAQVFAYGCFLSFHIQNVFYPISCCRTPLSLRVIWDILNWASWLSQNLTQITINLTRFFPMSSCRLSVMAFLVMSVTIFLTLSC